MRSGTKYSISSREVHDRTAGTIQEHVGITDHGPKCTASVVISIVLYAASRITSIFDACQRLGAAPSDQAVRDALRKAEATMRSGLEHALAAGRLLIEAKAQCQHGEWGQWSADNFDGSERTAQAYMRVAKRWPELETKAQRVADLTLRRALRAVASNSQKIAAVTERRRQAVLDAWEEHDCANAHQAVYRVGREPVDDLLCEPAPRSLSSMMAITASGARRRWTHK